VNWLPGSNGRSARPHYLHRWYLAFLYRTRHGHSRFCFLVYFFLFSLLGGSDVWQVFSCGSGPSYLLRACGPLCPFSFLSPVIVSLTAVPSAADFFLSFFSLVTFPSPLLERPSWTPVFRRPWVKFRFGHPCMDLALALLPSLMFGPSAPSPIPSPM